MRKFLLLAVLAAALAVPSMAAAATPQGNLTGSATIDGSFTFAIRGTVIDGGMNTYVGLENDFSGKCHGDDGSVVVAGVLHNVFCAHFVASSGCCNTGNPKMRLAYQVGPEFRVVRITDNGDSPDTWAIGIVSTFDEARAWVNLGAVGSSHPGGWTFSSVVGDYHVTP